MTVLFELCDEVLITIMTQWLDLKDVMCIDSACCSLMERNQILNLFQHNGFAMHNVRICQQTVLDYLRLRWIKLNDVFFTDFSTIENMSLNTTRMTTVRFHMRTFSLKDCIKSVIPFLNKCCSLKKLQLPTCRSRRSLIPRIDSKILENLEHLYAHKYNVDERSLMKLTEYCTSLTQLSLLVPPVPIILVNNLLQVNRNLLFFHLSGVVGDYAQVLNVLTHSCKMLISCFIYAKTSVAEEFDLTCVINLFKHCRNLQEVDLGYSHNKIMTCFRDHLCRLAVCSPIVHLAHVRFGSNNVRLSDYQLMELLNLLPSYVIVLHRLTKRLANFIISCRYEHLKRLVAKECAPDIHADDAISILFACPTLKRLELLGFAGDNNRVTDWIEASDRKGQLVWNWDMSSSGTDT